VLLATDLDGTLLFEKGKLAESEQSLLRDASEAGITRVLLTGRNYFSLNTVISSHAPFDYVCYSSGAGIIRWSDKKVLREAMLQKEDSERLTRRLKEQKANFFRLFPLPDNQQFTSFQGNRPPEDFYRRKHRYAPWERFEEQHDCSQFLVICRDSFQRDELMNLIRRELPQLSLISATSPMDHQTPWLEIFPEQVNKSGALKYLCPLIGVSRNKVYALGNDWNDQDMLLWAEKAWVVKNAPPELASHFETAEHESGSALQKVLQRMLGDMNDF